MNKSAFLLVIGNAFCCLSLTSDRLHRTLKPQSNVIKLFPRNIMAISKQPQATLQKAFPYLIGTESFFCLLISIDLKKVRSSGL